MTTAATPYINLNRSAAQHPLTLGGGVPGTRLITCTSPLLIDGGASADLSANRTLSLITSPTGQVPVGVSRLITATDPVLIDGGASADLSAGRTISMRPFDGTHSGYVVKNSSVLGQFYGDDGGWHAGTVVGVSSVAASGAITVSAATGAVTIGTMAAGLSNVGHVPAIGSPDATKALFATNPPSFLTVPGIGSVITLQNTSPGAADTGNGHISGVFIAEQAALLGPASSTGFAGNPNLTIGVSLGIQTNNASGGVLFMQASGTGAFNKIFMQKTRGTVAAPTATQNFDVMGSIAFAGTGSGSGIGAVLQANADGNAGVGQAEYFDTRVGDPDTNTFSIIRSSKSGVVVYSGNGSDSTKRALSDFEIDGSFGIAKTLISADTSASAHACAYLIDGTSNAVTLTLPTAVGCAGRIYSATRVDNIGFSHDVIIATTSAQTIDGAAQAQLYFAGNFISVISDGSNWWTIAANKPIQNRVFSNPIADTLANITGPLGFATGFILDTNSKYTKGGTFRFRWQGVASCTGTPTLRLGIYFINGSNVMSHSGDYTMPSGITSCQWAVDGTVVLDESGNALGFGSIFYMPVSVPPHKTVPIIGVDGGTTFSTPSNFGLQVTWSAADPANTITCTGARMDYFPPGHHS